MGEHPDDERYLREVLVFLRDRGFGHHRVYDLWIEVFREGVTHQTGTPPDQ